MRWVDDIETNIIEIDYGDLCSIEGRLWYYWYSIRGIYIEKGCISLAQKLGYRIF
jgi:hypothetical protein